MVDVTAFILGICHPQRLDWLKKNLDHLDAQNFPFVKKILAVDEFDGHTFPDSLKEEFETRDWLVLVDNHRSRALSTTHALDNVESNYVFYNEDDVLSTLPSPIDLYKSFDTIIDDRLCGMISMTLGGTKFEAVDHNIGDLRFIDKNMILEGDGYKIFRRMEEYANPWFFEYPGLFIRTDLYKSCHEWACAHLRGHPMERGLTKAWFEGHSYHTKYFKCSICKSDALQTLIEAPAKVNSHCRLLTNLDARQGASPLGGGHRF